MGHFPLLIVEVNSFSFFGQGDDRDVVWYSTLNDRKLWNSPIKDDEVRSGPLWVIETAGDYLFHRMRIGVITFMDLKVAVLGFVWRAVPENHHRTDVVLPLVMGQVIALNSHWWSF